MAKPAVDYIIYGRLVILHLITPNDVSESWEVMSWIAGNLPKDIYVNIMSQYRLAYKAFEYPDISRRMTRDKYREVVSWAKALGLTNLYIQ